MGQYTVKSGYAALRGQPEKLASMAGGHGLLIFLAVGKGPVEGLCGAVFLLLLNVKGGVVVDVCWPGLLEAAALLGHVHK
ncbi:hypothetical protein Dimus_012765 [Dionaea muscipula]